MKVRVFLACAAVAALASACAKTSNPTQPSSTDEASAALTSSVTVPRPLSPAAGALVPNGSQPVTLVVTNALVTRAGAVTYTFEVATDAAFAAKVYTKSGVAEGAAQTSLTIDRLAAGADYYWHARAESGGTSGPFSAPRRLTIGPAIVINPPTPVSPLAGAVTQGWPAFIVTNASRSGPVGSIVYRFEVSTSATFGTILLTGTVPEATNQTSYTPPASQPAPSQTNLFWRAIASDPANGVSSPASAIQSFTYANPTQQSILAAQQGFVLWPGAQPAGSTGHASMGPGWALQTLTSFDGARFTSPTLDELRIFDLLDRGMDPFAAIAWMNSNGYSTVAVYYPNVAAIGFPYQYMASIGGQWELVLRVGA